MASDLLHQGLQLMLVGMGTVFVFLAILVDATTLMSRLIVRFQGEADPNAAGSEVDSAVIAAITAAVTQYRK